MRSQCPCCKHLLEFEWRAVNTKVVRFHSIECPNCHAELRLAKRWLFLAIMCVLTVPWGLVMVFLLDRMNELRWVKGTGDQSCINQAPKSVD